MAVLKVFSRGERCPGLIKSLREDEQREEINARARMESPSDSSDNQETPNQTLSTLLINDYNKSIAIESSSKGKPSVIHHGDMYTAP